MGRLRVGLIDKKSGEVRVAPSQAKETEVPGRTVTEHCGGVKGRHWHFTVHFERERLNNFGLFNH